MGTLYEENLVAPDAFQKSWLDFAIAKVLDVDFTLYAAVALANLVR